MESIRIFLASPGDVGDERELVTEIIEDLQLTVGKTKNIHLELVKWETHAYPDIASYSQEVINNQVGDYSVLIGIMWKRFGTKTKNANSGTEEEFNLAYEVFKKHGLPKIMFYFRTPDAVRNKDDLKQLESIFNFKEKLQENGALYWEYSSIRDFERKLRVHLYHHIENVLKPKTTPALDSKRIFLSHRSKDQDRVSQIYKTLIEHGYKPWMAEYDILPGQSWKQEIDTAIRDSEIFLSFMSKNSSEKSETGFSVDSELSIAEHINEYLGEQESSDSKGNKIHIVPIRLDDVEMPEAIQHLQYLDMIDLDDSSKLLEVISNLLNTSS